MLAELLKNSKRPVLILGGGLKLSDFTGIRDLIKFIQIPILITWKGIDLVDDENPYYIGRFGVYGQRPANFCIQNCDLFIAIGTKLGLAQIGYNPSWFAREAKRVIVDIDINELKKFEFEVDLRIEKDCGQFLTENIDIFSKNNWSEWLNMCKNWKLKYPMILPDYKKQNINSYYFIDILSNCLNNDEVIVPGASGTAFTNFHQAFKVKLGQNIYTSNGFAEMGFDLPGAIGAYFATNAKRIILITGDGSFQMNIQELQTIKHHNIPIKIFYFDNGEYLTIKNTLDNIYDGNYVAVAESNDVSFPNIEKICHAYGINFISCDKTEELENKINETINSSGPMLCRISMVKNQAYIPKISYRQLRDGNKVACPLEDLAPFLSRDELKKNMVIPLLEESLVE